MTFSSPGFLFIFLPLCMIGYFVLGRFGRSSAIGFLAFMSFVFYAHWSKRYTLLLLASILGNYFISRMIAKSAKNERAQTSWLVIGIVGNLFVLGYFKYLFPLLQFVNGTAISHHDFGSVILPLGISFFTFTQIAYLIDLKQGGAERESLLSYLLFVTFFPHLIAGPILHHKEIMPQLREERGYYLDPADVALGLTWFSMGLFKKVMIADTIAPTVNTLFKDPSRAAAWQTWIGVIAYSMQLYFDFSGYSDMAVGLARIFSIRFPLNFDSPFKAASIIDFWQRWHMTLTRYIMGYLYSPILFWVSKRRLSRGEKVSKRAQATPGGFVQMLAGPTIITMIVAGIWHGAGVQFFAYGLIHGVYLTTNHLWRLFVPIESRLRRSFEGFPAIALTYFCVLISFVLFRSSDMHQAFTIYGGMLGLHGIGDVHGLHLAVIQIVGLALIIWLMPNTQELLGEQQKGDDSNWSVFAPRRWEPNVFWCAVTTAMFVISAAYSSAQTTFLYFQF
jgi:alginate O-acetyltransferase complex protein AlgI